MSLTSEQQSRMLGELLALEGNAICADCSEKHPTWASVNNSVLVCFQCAGIHRSLGAEISQIKSVKLDAWLGQEVAMLSQGVSTQFVNENLLESCVPAEYQKPHSSSSREVRERYIREKYVHRTFLPGKGKPRLPPVTVPVSPQQTTSSSSNSHVAQSAGAIEFVGILKVMMMSGKDLGGAAVPTSQQLKSLPHLCVGLGSQIFKTKPGKGDKNNPEFQEELLFSWDGNDPLNIEVMDADSFVRDDSLGYASVDVADLQLPSGVPLFLDVPLNEAAAGGSLQMQLLVERLDH